MSFKDLDTGEGLYITPAIRGLVAQRFDFLRPKRIVMFSRLMLGLRHGRKLMESGALDGLTLADGLEQIPELRGDARVIFLCALCLMSSLSAGEVLESPAAFFFHKLAVHHDVMSLNAGFTRAYVQALAAFLVGAASRALLWAGAVSPGLTDRVNHAVFRALSRRGTLS